LLGVRSSCIRVICIQVNMVIASIGTTWTQCTCIFEKSNWSSYFGNYAYVDFMKPAGVGKNK